MEIHCHRIGCNWRVSFIVRRYIRTNYPNRPLYRSVVRSWICALPGNYQSAAVQKDERITLTFYVFLFGTLFLLAGIETTGNIQPITDLGTVGYLFLLALIPTVVANLALVKAIKSIGSSLSSVLGAMEPVTAVCVGILVFGEAFTGSIGVGIALIISAVIIIILKR